MTAQRPPWVRVTLPVYDGNDELHVPSERVLEVAVVDDVVFLDLCEFDETHDTTTTKTIASAQVDASALANALAVQMGIERVRLALPLDGVRS